MQAETGSCCLTVSVLPGCTCSSVQPCGLNKGRADEGGVSHQLTTSWSAVDAPSSADCCQSAHHLQRGHLDFLWVLQDETFTRCFSEEKFPQRLKNVTSLRCSAHILLPCLGLSRCLNTCLYLSSVEPREKPGLLLLLSVLVMVYFITVVIIAVFTITP